MSHDRAVLSFDSLHAIMDGYVATQILHAAVQCNLFTLVGNGRTREEIVRSLGMTDQAARILLLGCVALGLLEKDGEHFRCAEVTAMTLVDGSPLDQRSVVAFNHRVCYRAMWRLGEALQRGGNACLRDISGTESTLYGRLAHDPDAEQSFHDMMGTVTRLVARQMVREIDLTGATTLLDIAGGTGVNAIALAQRFPALRITIFDVPSVAHSAKERVAAAGLSSRIDVVAGDCFTTELPQADRILFAHFLEIWSPQQIRELLSRGLRALNPGGEMLLINMIQEDDETGPLSAATASAYLYALASGVGMAYTWREYEEWLRSAGAVPQRRHKLTPAHGLIVARKVSRA